MKKFLYYSVFLLTFSYIFADIDYNSIVKINVTSQTRNYKIPWMTDAIDYSSGTGFIISGNIILTNAHVVANAKYIEVQRYDNSKNYTAEIQFISHSLDLALINVKDKSFFTNIKPLEIGPLPSLNSEVQTVGYPIGGNTISFTTGVVSRIDHVSYAHPQNDYHLVVQTDAAINPGNSGGPVLQNEIVVGMAFQGISAGDNIGYMIPTTLINHFIKDSLDGKINGNPKLGIYFSNLNPYLKEYLNLNQSENGIIINAISPKSPAENFLKKYDVLTRIDDYPIDCKGNVIIDNVKLRFFEILERKQVRDNISIDLIREGNRHNVIIPLKNYKPTFNHAREFNNKPPFKNIKGLVFTTLSMDYLNTSSPSSWSDTSKFIYYYQDLLNPEKKIQEYIVLSEVIKNSDNYHAAAYKGMILKKVNDIDIINISDLKKAFNINKTKYHQLYFFDKDFPLIIRNADYEV